MEYKLISVLYATYYNVSNLIHWICRRGRVKEQFSDVVLLIGDSLSLLVHLSLFDHQTAHNACGGPSWLKTVAEDMMRTGSSTNKERIIKLSSSSPNKRTTDTRRILLWAMKRNWARRIRSTGSSFLGRYGMMIICLMDLLLGVSFFHSRGVSFDIKTVITDYRQVWINYSIEENKNTRRIHWWIFKTFFLVHLLEIITIGKINYKSICSSLSIQRK